MYLVFDARFFQSSISTNGEKEKNGGQVDKYFRPSN